MALSPVMRRDELPGKLYRLFNGASFLETLLSFLARLSNACKKSNCLHHLHTVYFTRANEYPGEACETSQHATIESTISPGFPQTGQNAIITMRDNCR